MRRVPDNLKAEIISRYRNGETTEEIGQSLGKHWVTIRDNLKRWGEPIRSRGTRRRLQLDEGFFDVIDTEEKAYWLGFILADGCVNKTGAGNWCLRVDLAAVDRDHLAKLQRDMSNGSRIKIGHNGASVYLDACSVKLCMALIALGVTPNKTGNHGTPVVPREWTRDFYRGVVDGDGSVFWDKGSCNWCFSLTGAMSFLETTQDWLMQQALLNRTKIQPKETERDVGELRYTGTRQVARICRLLYEGAAVCLGRKEAQARECMQSPGINQGSVLRMSWG